MGTWNEAGKVKKWRRKMGTWNEKMGTWNEAKKKNKNEAKK